MRKGKKMVCLCEDVTEEDVERAIERGFNNIELIKRYAGIGTGPCQGRSCVPHVIRILSKKLGKSPDEIGVPTPHPPVCPVFLGTLAAGKERGK